LRLADHPSKESYQLSIDSQVKTPRHRKVKEDDKERQKERKKERMMFCMDAQLGLLLSGAIKMEGIFKENIWNKGMNKIT
jgi:hypothetical protein